MKQSIDDLEEQRRILQSQYSPQNSYPDPAIKELGALTIPLSVEASLQSRGEKDFDPFRTWRTEEKKSGTTIF